MKVSQIVLGATLEVEGDDADVAETCRRFHLFMAENSLKDVEQKIADLRPILRPLFESRRKLKAHIASLIAQGTK